MRSFADNGALEFGEADAEHLLTLRGEDGRTADRVRRLDFFILDELGYCRPIAASTSAMSKPPSASRLIRPAASAFLTAVSLTPRAPASWRLLVARMAISVPSQQLNLDR